MEIAHSVHGVPIRLTAERWLHIVETHDEMAGREDDVLRTIEYPECVTRGIRGTLVAWRGFGRLGHLSVIYKELGKQDGFVITAFLVHKVKKGTRVWPK